MTRALLAGILALSGCALTDPPFECDDSDWEPGQTCDRVLDAARRELPAAWEIESLQAVEGIYCPPFAGCPFTPFVVTVHADLVDGRRLYVSVDLHTDGSLSARAAEVVEPEP